MTDYLGNDLKEGDEVVFITPRYRDFSKGIIKRFTKYYAFIENPKSYSGEIKQEGHQLIKVV